MKVDFLIRVMTKVDTELVFFSFFLSIHSSDCVTPAWWRKSESLTTETLERVYAAAALHFLPRPGEVTEVTGSRRLRLAPVAVG